MTLYHMKNDGTPGVCSAQPGNCPLSNSSIHTHSLEEAQDFADRMNEIKALNIYEKVRLNSNNNLDKDEDTTYLSENQIKKLEIADLYVLSKPDLNLEQESENLIKGLNETETLLTEHLQKEYYLNSDKARVEYEDNYKTYLFNKFKPDGYPLEIKNVAIKTNNGSTVNKNIKISLTRDLNWEYSYSSKNKDVPVDLEELEKGFFSRPDVKPYMDENWKKRAELLKLEENSVNNSIAKLKRDREQIKLKRIELEDKLDLYSRELAPLSERISIQRIALNELKNRGY